MSPPPGPEPRRAPDEQELVRAAHASEALRQLLAAASAPPTTAELTGRARALAAFRSVYRLRRPASGVQQPAPGTPAGAEQQEQADLAAASLSEASDGDNGADRQRRSRVARARRWSAAQLTLAGTTLVMLLGASAART